jgi:hypothetical protein
MYLAAAKLFFRLDRENAISAVFLSPSVALESTELVVLRVKLVRSAKNWFMLDDERGLV